MRFFEIRESLLSTTSWSTTCSPTGLDWVRKINAEGCVLSGWSRLGKRWTDKYLDESGLAEFIPSARVVTPEDGYETPSQTLLGCSLLTRIQPKKSIVFDATPSGVLEAHEAGMKCVAIGGGEWKMWEMKVADLVVGDFEELYINNIQRMFLSDDDEPEFQTELEPEVEDGGGGRKNRNARRWD